MIFCITSTLSAACDDDLMTTSDLCISNTIYQWTAASTGTYGSTTTYSDGVVYTSQTEEDECSGNCFWSSSSCTNGNMAQVLVQLQLQVLLVMVNVLGLLIMNVLKKLL